MRLEYFRVLYIILIFNYNSSTAQIFQYFIVNNNDATAKVIDTVKLPTCAHLDSRENVTLRGGIHSGKFTKHGLVKNMQTCIDACCQDQACDVAFMPGRICYTVNCFTDELCQSIPATPSQAANGSVQISHVVRGGGKGDDLDEFRKSYGINKNGGKKKVCIPGRIAYNYTLRGSKFAGEMIDTGSFKDPHECFAKCCEHDTCEVAYMLNEKCYAVDCYTKGLCQSIQVRANNDTVSALVYVNKRNGVRQKDKDTCDEPCVNGLCTKNDTCMCDIGFRGSRCNETEIIGRCDPDCGLHGRCIYNDTCECMEGYKGYRCDQKVVCKEPCHHGLCIELKDANQTSTCRCSFGWDGDHCNETTTSDKVMLASSGEEVLFTDMDQEAEMDIKIHDGPNVKESESISALAVAIGCGIAAAMVGTAAVVFIARQVFAKKTVTNYELLNAPRERHRR